LRLELPAASPAIFAGLRVSAGLSVIGAIVGDFFFTRGTPGLGRLVIYFFQDTRSGPMFITTLIATLIGVGFFVVVEVLRKVFISPWHHP
jgi:NitT/TauT family transport system permease protein